MIEQRVVRYSVPRGSYGDMEVLKNAPKRTETGQRQKYAEILEMLKKDKQTAAQALMHGAGISVIHGDRVSKSTYFTLNATDITQLMTKFMFRSQASSAWEDCQTSLSYFLLISNTRRKTECQSTSIRL